MKIKIKTNCLSDVVGVLCGLTGCDEVEYQGVAFHPDEAAVAVADSRGIVTQEAAEAYIQEILEKPKADENTGLLACLHNLRAELDGILSDDEAWGITPMECRRKIIKALREKIRDIVEKREAADD